MGDFRNSQQRISQASRRQSLHAFSIIYECVAVDLEHSARVITLLKFQTAQPCTVPG